MLLSEESCASGINSDHFNSAEYLPNCQIIGMVYSADIKFGDLTAYTILRTFSLADWPRTALRYFTVL